jgi:TetR/AcrR family transcriptional regulator, ethionamide resistance regulator
MSSHPASRARRGAARTRREAARERILTAAEQLMRERPYRELSVEEVMARAELSRTVFYRHFDGLPELVLSLFETVTQRLMDELQAPPDPGATQRILGAAVDAYAEHGGLLRAVAEAASHDAEIEAAYRAVVDAFTAVMAGQIEQGMAAGRIRPGNAYELARALNLMNANYLLDTLGRDPGFDRRLAVETLLAVWGPVTTAP